MTNKQRREVANMLFAKKEDFPNLGCESCHNPDWQAVKVKVDVSYVDYENTCCDDCPHEDHHSESVHVDTVYVLVSTGEVFWSIDDKGIVTELPNTVAFSCLNRVAHRFTEQLEQLQKSGWVSANRIEMELDPIKAIGKYTRQEEHRTLFAEEERLTVAKLALAGPQDEKEAWPVIANNRVVAIGVKTDLEWVDRQSNKVDDYEFKVFDKLYVDYKTGDVATNVTSAGKCIESPDIEFEKEFDRVVYRLATKGRKACCHLFGEYR